MSRGIRRGPGAWRRQAQARQELDRLFHTISSIAQPPQRQPVEVIYKRKRVVPSDEVPA